MALSLRSEALMESSSVRGRGFATKTAKSWMFRAMYPRTRILSTNARAPASATSHYRERRNRAPGLLRGVASGPGGGEPRRLHVAPRRPDRGLQVGACGPNPGLLRDRLQWSAAARKLQVNGQRQRAAPVIRQGRG